MDAVIEQGFADRDAGAEPNAMSALGVVVDSRRRGRGLSSILLDALNRLARAEGFEHFVVPVRPTMKASYPLIPMEQYVGWRTDDGLPFDPWMRTQARRWCDDRSDLLAVDSAIGSVAHWERWAGMAFPDSGEHIVPGVLAPVVIDRVADTGLYQLNVWMRHVIRS